MRLLDSGLFTLTQPSIVRKSDLALSRRVVGKARTCITNGGYGVPERTHGAETVSVFLQTGRDRKTVELVLSPDG